MIRIVGLALPALLLGAACSSSGGYSCSDEDAPRYVLHVGGSHVVGTTQWSVKLDSVVSDSRCPLGVLCIQAGEALLAMELTNPAADPGPPDNPHFTLGTTQVTVDGFRFFQIDIQPIRQQNQTIDPSVYVATLRVGLPCLE